MAIDARVGFLDKLEKNYEIYESFHGNLDISYFPEIFRRTAVEILKNRQKFYVSTCERFGKNPDDISAVFLNKDKSGNLYMMIVGADERTNLIIRKNNSNIDDYKSIPAVKALEIEFVAESDRIQLDDLETAKISKRFLKDKDDYVSFNPIDEYKIKELFKYALFLRDYAIHGKKVDITFSSDKSMPREKKSNADNGERVSYERVNEVLDTVCRFGELERRDPFVIIDAKSNNNDNDCYRVFLFHKNDGILAFAEPNSGERFSRVIFFPDGVYNKAMEEDIIDILKCNDETKLDEYGVVKSSHTSFERFRGNINFLFDGDNSNTSLSFKNNITDMFAKRDKLPTK